MFSCHPPESVYFTIRAHWYLVLAGVSEPSAWGRLRLVLLSQCGSAPMGWREDVGIAKDLSQLDLGDVATDLRVNVSVLRRKLKHRAFALDPT